MNKNILKIITTFIFFFLPFSGNGELIDMVVASIDGDPITLQDLKTQMPLVVGKESWELLTQEEKEKILDEIIEEKILTLEAEKNGIKIDTREEELSVENVLKNRSITRDELEKELKNKNISWTDYISEIRRQILKEKVLQKIILPRINVSNEILKTFYMQNKEKFVTKEALHLYHIMLPFDTTNIKQTKEEAQNIYKEFQQGTSFESIVRKYLNKDMSEVDLGIIQKGDLLPELDRILFSTPAGHITKPVESGNAIHIFYVKERKKPEIKSFEEAINEVREEYFKESAEKLYAEWLGKSKEQHLIKIIYKEL